MRHLLLLSLLAVSAVAQPKRSALGSGKDDDEVPAKPVVTANADLALLRALLFASEPNPPEVRIQSIEDLGLLGDARALNSLAQLVYDPNPLVWAAALRSIGAIRNPRAEEILANVVKHPTLSEGHKLKALEFLPFQNTTSALRFISSLPRTSTAPLSVQNLSRRILAEIPSSRGGTL